MLTRRHSCMIFLTLREHSSLTRSYPAFNSSFGRSGVLGRGTGSKGRIASALEDCLVANRRHILLMLCCGAGLFFLFFFWRRLFSGGARSCGFWFWFWLWLGFRSDGLFLGLLFTALLALLLQLLDLVMTLVPGHNRWFGCAHSLLRSCELFRFRLVLISHFESLDVYIFVGSLEVHERAREVQCCLLVEVVCRHSAVCNKVGRAG